MLRLSVLESAPRGEPPKEEVLGMGRISRRFAALAVGVVAGLALVTGVAGADSPGWTTISTQFTSPLFGLAPAPDNQLIVADAGAGITRLRLSNGTTSLITPLPGV